MKLPNGPQTPPLLQMLQWIATPLELMETCAKRYGDFFTLRVGKNFVPVVFISHPQAIQEIFTADSKQFDVGKANGILRPLLGDRSMILLDGERHQRQRRLLMPTFHGERMRAYGKLIRDITDQVISEWEISKPFNVRESMQQISLQVILHAVFGLGDGQRYQQLKHLLAEMLNVTSSPLSSTLIFVEALQRDLGAWSPWGRFLERRREIKNLIYEELRERRQLNSSGSDILSLMMSARDEAGQPMSDEELHDELMTLLIAGHETTATALSWAFYWLHRQPESLEKLRHELNATNYDSDPSAIAQLPYLSAVCQETLRLYPVGLLTFPRVLKSPMRLMGFEFEPGTALLPCIYLTHHRQDIYPQSKQFKPERFLERQFSPYEYLPFGGGSRRCIGMAFALFEMKIVLATVLLRYNMAIAPNNKVRPVRRGVTLSPSAGKWLIATSQRQQAKIPVQV